MRVRVMMSRDYPEYRLVIPVTTAIESLDTDMQQAIRQLGDWEERSQDELDQKVPVHREALEVISTHGAYLWVISADYTGRVELVRADECSAEE